MRVKHIDSAEKWNILSDAMREKGYKLWQMQYCYNYPEGFHAWFWKAGKEEVEVVTFNKDVQRLIIGFES